MAKDLTASQLADAYKGMSLIGENVKGIVVAGKLLLEIDTEVELGLSSTEITYLKANTGGPKHVIGLPADQKISVLMTRKNPAYVKPPKVRA
jgi:hypothetical protein